MGEIDIHVKSEVQRPWRVGVLLAMMGAREKVLSSKLGLIWFKREAQLNSHLLREPTHHGWSASRSVFQTPHLPPVGS